MAKRSLLGFAVENSPEADVIEAVAVVSAEKSARLFYGGLSSLTSPLDLAVKRFDAFPIALQVLLDVGIENGVWDCPDGQRALKHALAEAVATNRIGAAVALLGAGADPNADLDGESALKIAVANVCVPCVLALLKHGADPWAKTKNGDRIWEKAGFSEKAAALVKRAALKKMSTMELPKE